MKTLGVLNDVDDLTATLRAELDCTRNEGEQRVVTTATDTRAGVEVRSALANNDFAGLDDLTAVALDAEILGVRIAPITSGGRSLFVCHVVALPRLLDAGNFHAGKVSAETLTLVVPRLVLELVNDDLGAAKVFDDLSRDRHLGESRGVRFNLVAVNEKDGRKRNRTLVIRLDTIDSQNGPNFDLFLSPSGAHNRVNHGDVLSKTYVRSPERNARTNSQEYPIVALEANPFTRPG
jgi:hypothetical protein